MACKRRVNYLNTRILRALSKARQAASDAEGYDERKEVIDRRRDLSKITVEKAN